jgi:NodT family efflux transporter outer membrane factor (OMF) lipoprotein
MKKYMVFVVAAALLGGCYVKPEQSNLTLPEQFETNVSMELGNISATWWESFNSTTLDTLIAQALKSSPDMLIAYENIIQARLNLGIAESDYFPSVDISAGSSESRTKPDGGDSMTSKSTSANLRVNYEIDLWGKVRAANAQAAAQFNSTRWDTDALKLTLSSSVAQSYFTLLSLQQRLEIARDNLAISQRLMDIVDAKYTNGAVSLLDVSRQRSSLLSQQAALEQLTLQAAQAKNALAVLVGSFPQGFSVTSDAFWELSLPVVGAGLPSELLLNRPDIARARADVDAANAAANIAQASRFPSFSLSGSGGLSSGELLSFKDPTSVLSLALNAAFTLFDAGRLADQKEIAVSRARSAVQSYNKVILTAFQESEDALLGVAYQNSQESLQQNITDEAKRSLDISSMQYRYGTTDLTTLLDAQRTYFSARDSLCSQRLNHLNALVTLYKVLGGGWREQEEQN